jgi:predicted hotdog family 3-hydroxylacyl-ACP dehydratase
MKNKEYLSTILPHEEPMILIDDVLGYSLEEKWLKSCVTITEDCMFFNKTINGVDSTLGIEYMAQTIGCYAFFRRKLKEPKIGFLLGTRLYNNAVNKFELGKTYYILVKEVFVAEIFSFECFIYNEDNEEIASSTINVYQSDDDENIKELINV